MPYEYEPQERPYVVGAHVSATASDNQMAAIQASETFHVSSTTALGDHGESEGFAKRCIGTSAQVLLQQHLDSGADEFSPSAVKLQDRLRKDMENAGNAGLLFFDPETTQAIIAQNQPDEILTPANYGPLADHLPSLNTRAVACYEIDKALGLNILSSEKHGLESNGQPLGISGRVSGVAVLQRPDNPQDYEKMLQTNYADANVQRGLSDLEALDYLTGQIDRHPGNMFINTQTGKVTGIDNDLALPEVKREDMLQNPQLAAKAVRTPPYFLHEETAAKIEAMTPDQLADAIVRANDNGPPSGGQISQQAIEGAQQRLQEMKTHIATLRQEGRIVPEFDGRTYNTTLDIQQSMTDQHIGAERAKADALQRPTGAYGTSELAGVPRTSYLGSILVEQQKTAAMNLRYTQRETVDGSTLAFPEPQNPLALYQAEKAALKERFINDPTTAQLANVSHAGVPQAIAAHEASEQRVALARQNLAQAEQAMGSMGGARLLPAAKQELAKALIEKVQTQRALDAALDRAVDPLKPQMEQNAIQQSKRNLEDTYIGLKKQQIEMSKNLQENISRFESPNMQDPRMGQLKAGLDRAIADTKQDLASLDDQIKEAKAQLIDTYQKLGEKVPSNLQSTGEGWKADQKLRPSQNQASNANSLRNNFRRSSEDGSGGKIGLK